jgi:hypothetical protein
VWNYLESSSPTRDGSYSLLPNFSRAYHDISGYKAWYGSDFSTCGSEHGDLPTVSLNANSSPITVCGHIHVPPRTVDVHLFAGHMAIVGWKSPVRGTVHISGKIVDLDSTCGNGIKWFIEHGTTGLARGAIQNGGRVIIPRGLSSSVAPGDFIYLMIAPMKTDFYCDSTRLVLSIIR